MLGFIQENKRWLAAGFLLTFASSAGQTWFISLFAGHIMVTLGLTDGSWGSLYTAATLAAAVLMFWQGSLADTVPLSRLAPAIAVLFALSAFTMMISLTVSPFLWLLGLSLVGLRFCGQGMFTHLAMTAMGRWFEARRGQAVAVSNLGHPASEIALPIVIVTGVGLLGTPMVWLLTAGILAFLVMPALLLLLGKGRTPHSSLETTLTPGLSGKQWRRRDAANHWLLPALLPTLLTPGFIGTVVFFHQVHVAEVKGWTLAAMAPGYVAFASLSVGLSFVGGWISDRFGPHVLLPIYLIPMGLGIALVAPAAHVMSWFFALGLIGMTQGLTHALFGTLFPKVYGTAHLGSIRSLATTIMVVSTAIGPGLTGLLIDQGITFPTQGLMMGLWCLGLSLAGLFIARRLSRELAG